MPTAFNVVNEHSNYHAGVTNDSDDSLGHPVNRAPGIVGDTGLFLMKFGFPVFIVRGHFVKHLC